MKKWVYKLFRKSFSPVDKKGFFMMDREQGFTVISAQVYTGSKTFTSGPSR